MSADAPLNGRTILRFAHAFESGGGTERYLDDLDHALLTRNAMTVVRLHLTRRPPGFAPTEQAIGRGRLIHVPLPIIPLNDAGHAAHDDEHSLRFRLKQLVRDWIIYNPLVWAAYGRNRTARLRLSRQPGQAIGAGEAAADVMRKHKVDLAMLHFFGGADADEVIVATQQARVPFAVLNHYSNDRYLHLAIRKHAMQADGISGVNGLQLPSYVRSGFANLSDGIDTDLFRRDRARPVKNLPAQPVLLLPARVVREKGQLDLVRAAAALRASGVDCAVAFAGRVDSGSFVEELKREIAQSGLTDRVHFLGGLNVDELRDWYAASAVVAFPTYHHEGLGRVIVEAQALNTPVVAYATGGVAEGIVDGETGYLLPTGDVQGLTARLRELLASPALREKMGAAGRRAAETRFSLAALAHRHEQFYARVIANYQADRTPGNRR